jgi:hypothetical protein
MSENKNENLLKTYDQVFGNFTFTPTGLKVYFPIEYSFTLISRFKGKIKAFDFLKTVEGYMNIVNILTWFIFIKAIQSNYDFYETLIYFIIIYIFSYFISIYDFKAFRGLVYLGKIYSYVSVFMIPQIIMLAAAFYYSRLDLLLITFILKFILDILSDSIDSFFCRKILSIDIPQITKTEVYFINTYLNYAEKYNISKDIATREEEIYSKKYINPLIELIREYPMFLDRYPHLNKIINSND